MRSNELGVDPTGVDGSMNQISQLVTGCVGPLNLTRTEVGVYQSKVGVFKVELIEVAHLGSEVKPGPQIYSRSGVGVDVETGHGSTRAHV